MDGGPSARDRRLSLVVPIVLLLVASTQVVIANTTDLTPWRLGGFGMFSTVDAHSTRFVRATMTTDDDVTRPVDVASLTDDDTFSDALVDHRAWPREASLHRFTRALTDSDLRAEDGILRPVETATTGTSDDDASNVGTRGRVLDEAGHPVEVASVTVEVWTASYDRDRGRLIPDRISRDEVSG